MPEGRDYIVNDLAIDPGITLSAGVRSRTDK